MIREGVIPRRYQEAILHTATRENTLVVLPTGMGKTLVAELLMAQRFSQYPESKILILAPTRPLVAQHRATFLKETTLAEEDAVLFTGNVAPAKRAKLWKEARVIFSTPQGLENDLVSQQISLADVSLLVFDEAHHATGEYSYVFIAERYRKEARHERILALTASPGSDKESIEAVCRNLYVESLEVRSTKSPDVAPYVQEIDIEHVKVQMPPELKAVHDRLKRCYQARIEDLSTLGVLNRQALANKTTLLRSQGALHARSARGEKSAEVFQTMKLLAEALKVQHAVELVETQGVHAVAQYMKKLEGDAKRGQSKAVQTLVRDHDFRTAKARVAQLEEENVEHPKLRALQKVVLRTLYADKEAKIIVFNQYRDQAVKIREALEGIHVTAKIFVGQLKKGDTGLTQKEQQQILSEFRNGEFNALVATSVAEEGLDIPKVDVVIFYEPVPSAIRTVQRRGRTGRLEKGRIVMLVTEGTRDVGYKWAAHHKEKRMYRVLDEVKRSLERGEQDVKEAKLQDFTKDEVKVVADHREKASGVLKALLDENVKVELSQLEIGDYRLSDRVVVEYKRVPDFVNSIVDGRLLEQLRGLRSYPRPLIVIEGEEDLYSMRKVHANAILGMLAAITVSYNIPVLFTRDSAETAALFRLIAKKEAGKPGKGFQPHAQKALSGAGLQEYVVSSLPGVGGTLAKRLLAHFGSIKGLVDASTAELEAVEKVGAKKARELYDVFRAPYEP